MGRRALATRETVEDALEQVRETHGWHTVYYKHGTLHGLEKVRAITRGCPYRVRSLLILILAAEGARIWRGEVDDAADVLGMRPKGTRPALEPRRAVPGTPSRGVGGSGGSGRPLDGSDGGRTSSEGAVALLARLEDLERQVRRLLPAGPQRDSPPSERPGGREEARRQPPPSEQLEAPSPGPGPSSDSAVPAGDGDRVFRLMRASRDARRKPHDADDG